MPCPECGQMCVGVSGLGVHRLRSHGIIDRDRRREKKRRCYARHPEKQKARSRRYYAAHREAILARDRAKYRLNPKNKRAQSRAWRQNNPDKYRAILRRWYHGNLEYARERCRVAALRRRAIKRAANGHATIEQVRARIAYYGERCWICGAPWAHLDHVLPLVSGGSNWPANIRPACATCNLRKGARHPSEILVCR